jgi:hypothetical protein
MKANASDLPKIGAPANRALERIGVLALQDLANYTKPELDGLHGLGPKAMSLLAEALAAHGMSFKSNTSVKLSDAH